MKELSIEEKAKAYDELLAKAKQIYNKENDVLIMHTIEDLFPELKESEDERIRKELIEFLKSASGGFLDTAIQCKTFGKWLTWLKKQGKNADIILTEMKDEGKHKFKIGDIISNGKVVYRIDDIVKNAIGQDCYFLVNVKMEKNDMRYLILTNSEGKTSHIGEITWLCEQVDKSFEKQDDGSVAEHRICYNKALQEVQCELDTLEVKEVDLDKEIDNIWKPRFNLGWDENSLLSVNHKGFTTIAKHFFELGLKAQKGE